MFTSLYFNFQRASITAGKTPALRFADVGTLPKRMYAPIESYENIPYLSHSKRLFNHWWIFYRKLSTTSSSQNRTVKNQRMDWPVINRRRSSSTLTSQIRMSILTKLLDFRQNAVSSIEKFDETYKHSILYVNLSSDGDFPSATRQLEFLPLRTLFQINSVGFESGVQSRSRSGKLLLSEKITTRERNYCC